MTTTGELIRAKLATSSQLVQRVGARIYSGMAPQGAGSPRIVFMVVSDVPQNSLGGAPRDRLRQIRLQVDSYARTALEAAQIAELIDEVLGDLQTPELSAWRENAIETYDDSAEMNRVLQEFTVFR